MQALALVTGDEFLIPYNLSITTEDVLDHIMGLTYYWGSEEIVNFSHFDDRYGIDYAFQVGPTGYCYNFNLVNSVELLNLEM